MQTSRRLLTAGLIIALWGCGPSEKPEQASAENTEPSGVQDEFIPVPSRNVGSILFDRVNAGEWTVAQGLINTLKIAVGETEPTAVYEEGVEFKGDLSRVIRMAQRYTENHEDSADTRELKRLLKLLVPDIKAIEHSIREKKNTGTTGITPAVYWPNEDGFSFRQTQAGAGSCEEAWQVGVGAAACFNQYPPDGGDRVIFYPSYWHQDPALMADVHRIMSAINKTYLAYEKYGEMGQISATMVLGFYGGSDDAEGQGTLAAARVDDEGICRATVYPPSLGSVTPKLEQTIAHEAFHCFQDWNTPAQSWGDGSAGWLNFTTWWAEGSAEHFSNVVYPGVNDEWMWAIVFDSRSPTTPVTGMEYEATVFFQYLEDRIGNNRIIELIRTLPTSQAISQAEALSRYPDIQNIFHSFGKDYLDGKILDSGNTSGHAAYWPLVPQIPQANLRVSRQRNIHAKRFVLARRSVKIIGDGALEQIKTTIGPEAQESFTRGSGFWETLPDSMAVSECVDEEPYLSLVTTTESGNEDRHTTELRLRAGESGGVGDPCKDCSYPKKRAAGANYDATCFWPCMDACWCSQPSMQDSGQATHGECFQRTVTWYADRRFAQKICDMRIPEGLRRDQLLKEHCTSTCSGRCLVSDVKNARDSLQ